MQYVASTVPICSENSELHGLVRLCNELDNALNMLNRRNLLIYQREIEYKPTRLSRRDLTIAILNSVLYNYGINAIRKEQRLKIEKDK